MERRIAEPKRPFTPGEVWGARLGVPLVLTLAVGLGMAFGLWGGLVAALLSAATQWLRMTPHQRSQVLGRATQ